MRRVKRCLRDAFGLDGGSIQQYPFVFLASSYNYTVDRLLPCVSLLTKERGIEMFFQFFSLSFFQALVSTLIGAFVGVFLAFSIDRHKSQRKIEKQQKELLRLLRATLEKNELRIKQLEGQLTGYNEREILLKKGMFKPTDRIDVLPLESAVSFQYELIDSINLKTHLETVRYELAHLNRQLDMFAVTGDVEDYRELVGTILALLRGVEGPSILKTLEYTLSLVNSELGDQDQTRQIGMGKEEAGNEYG